MMSASFNGLLDSPATTLQSCRRRGISLGLPHAVLALHTEWKRCKFSSDNLAKDKRLAGAAIVKAKRSKEPTAALIAAAKLVGRRCAAAWRLTANMLASRDRLKL